jgi:hypothetical protein
MDEDMTTWTRTWKHVQEHGNMDRDMATLIHGDMETWRHGYMDI